MSTETPETTRRAYTVRQFSETFGVSRATTYSMIAAGLIEARKAGGRTLIPVDSAEGWFASLPRMHDLPETRASRA